MVGAIASTGGVYHSPYFYPMSRQTRELAGAERAAVRPAQAAGLRVAAARRAQPDVPVQPAEAVKPVRDNVFNKEPDSVFQPRRSARRRGNERFGGLVRARGGSGDSQGTWTGEGSGAAAR